MARCYVELICYDLGGQHGLKTLDVFGYFGHLALLFVLCIPRFPVVPEYRYFVASTKVLLVKIV